MRGKFGFGFGGRWAGGPGMGFPGSRVKRGDIKFMLLEILKEGPRHGYEIIGGFEDRFEGYRPSPGSVYPTLQMLEEGGYLTSQEADGKKVYTITESGLTLLEERPSSEREEHPGMKEILEVGHSLKKLSIAVMSGARDTDEESRKRIGEILDKARKEVYAVLAES